MKTELQDSMNKPVSTSQATRSAARLLASDAPGKTSPKKGGRLALLLCALLSAVLLALCYFPVAWGVLGWLALVPMLVLVRANVRPFFRFCAAWLCGIVFHFIVLRWMRVADDMMVITWFASSFYLGLYFPLSIWLARRMEMRWKLPLALSFPLVWVAWELFRASFIVGGFSWYQMGQTQHSFLRLIQIADLGGVYLVSFLVVAVNALILEWALRSEWVRARFKCGLQESPSSRSGLVFQSAILLLCFAGCLVYGGFRMSEASFTPGPKIALVQGNVPQGVRNSGSGGGEQRLPAVKQMQKHYFDLTIIARKQSPELIVWPETSWPIEWEEAPEELLRNHPDIIADKDLLREVPKRCQIPLLVGVNLREWSSATESKRYNSAVLFGTDGKITGRYDKIHRVPFGEYIPLHDTLPWLASFSPYDYEYSIQEGQDLTRLPVGKHRFGVVICYEDTDAPLAAGYVAPGGREKADFLINLSNDGWFLNTNEHADHLAFSRFRAIECRRPLARSVNTGISALIDGNGRVLRPRLIQQWKMVNLWTMNQKPGELPPRDLVVPMWTIGEGETEELPQSEWSSFIDTPGVLICHVPLDGRDTLYAHWGDWLPKLCWLVIGLYFLSGILSFIVKRLRGNREPSITGSTA